jgi:tetratricopeptide (TPR) repeat protein
MSRDITATKASIYLSEGEFALAADEYTVLIEKWKEATVSSHYMNRAVCHDSLAQYDAAISDYSKASIYDRDKLLPILARADVYMRQNKLMQAQTDYRRITRLDPENALAWKGLGKISMKQDRSRYAYDEFSNAIRFGADAETYFLRAECLYSLDREDEARRDIEQAAKMGHHGAKNLLESQRP